MYSITPVQKVLPFEQEKDLERLFCAEVAINLVWGTTGHVFVSINNAQEFQAYDLAPLDQKVEETKRALAIRHVSSEVIAVCALKKKQYPVYIAHKNGALKVWTYSSIGGWIHLGNISLCSTIHHCLEYVTIDEERSRIFWVETHADNNGCHYSVCTRTMTFDTTSVKHSIGPVTSLIMNGPKCSIHCSALAVIVWPSQPASGTGLYFTWSSNQLKNKLDSNILGRGRCISHDDSDVDFQSVACKLRHVWVQTCSNRIDLQIIAKAWHPSTRLLYLLSDSGSMHILDGVQEKLNAAKFPGNVNISKGNHWFAFRFIIGAIFVDHVMRLFNNVSAELLQEIDMRMISPDVSLWTIEGAIPRCGVYSSKGIWIIEMSSVESITSKLDKPEATNIVSDFNESLLATSVMMSKLSQDSIGQRVITEVASNGVQNESLSLSLLQTVGDAVRPAVNQSLQSLFEKKDTEKQLSTNLNDKVTPLLKKYWELHQENMNMWNKDSQIMENVLTVDIEVFRLLSPSINMASNLRSAQLDYLCMTFPKATLRAFIRALDIGSVNQCGDVILHTFSYYASDLHYCTTEENTFTANKAECRPLPSELKPRPSDTKLQLPSGSHCMNPVISLALEAPQSQSGLPIFEILCRLFYSQYPTILVEFVQCCQMIRDEVSNTMTFTKKSFTINLFDLAFNSLPSPNHSIDIKDAAIAMAHLLQLSTIPNSSLNALKILLWYKLWNEAIELTDKTIDDPHSHCQLFYVLLTAILQERDVIAIYTDRLWNCLPRNTSCVELLKLISNHHQASNPRIQLCQQVLCKSDRDLQIGMIKNQLIQMLNLI